MSDRVAVEYTGGQTVHLPQWLLDERGKNLLGLIQEAFGPSAHVRGLIPEVRIAQNLPVELADTLRSVADA